MSDKSKMPAEKAAELLASDPEMGSVDFVKVISQGMVMDIDRQAGKYPTGDIFSPVGELCLVFEVNASDGTVHPIGASQDTEQRHDFSGQTFTHSELWEAIQSMTDDEVDWLGRRIQRGMLAVQRLDLAQCAAQAAYTFRYGQPEER